MSWVSEYIPEVLLIIVLLSIGVAITIIGFNSLANLNTVIFDDSLVWSRPVPYQHYWLVQVSLIYPNPITPPLRPGEPRGYAWGWGVRKHIPFLAIKQLKFMTQVGIEPGYALECGNYTISSIQVYYCTFLVKAYPIMPLISR